jgi:hypothetical protein
MSENNPECPHCGGVAPSTNSLCGLLAAAMAPPVVPTFDFDPLFDLIWMEAGTDWSTDMEAATTLDEDLWDEEGFHPWDGLRYGYELETRCTYRQTLETPAEYLTTGSLWITDEDGKVLADRWAGDFQ